MNQQTDPQTYAGLQGKVMRFLNLFSWKLFLLIVFLSTFKFLLFKYFSEAPALLSADFIIVILLISLFFGRFRAICIFIFTTGYFLIFIALTFINFFHFTWKSFVNSLQFYQQLDLTKYFLLLLVIIVVVFALYFIPKIFFKKVIIRYKLPDILLWVVVLSAAFYIQKKYLFHYTTFIIYVSNDHTQASRIFNLVDKGDINTLIEEDKLFAFTFHSKDSLASFSATMHGPAAFEKYAAQSKGTIQLNILLESLGKFNEGPGQNLFRDSINQWLAPTNYELIYDTVPFKGSTVDGELRELFDLRGDYNLIIESGKEFNSIFKEKEKEGFSTYSVSSSSGKVFSDRDLYKIAGCDSSFFKEDLINLPNFNSATDLGRESSFIGVRDEFTFDFMMKKMDASKARKQFWYFLTINTHLPFTLNANDKASEAYKTFKSKFAPAYTNNVSEQTFKFIQELKYFITVAMQHNVSSITMVGDHSPPYFAAADRKFYSQELVPVYFIRKKN